MGMKKSSLSYYPFMGVSRKLLWLKVAKSNNNPSILVALYVEIFRELDCYPKYLKIDYGTENGVMADVHYFPI